MLFDDIFARCASMVFESGVAMTAKMEVDFRKRAIPVRPYIYRAEIVKMEGRKAWVTSQMQYFNEFSAHEMSKQKATTRLYLLNPRFGKVRVAAFPCSLLPGYD